MGTVQPCERSFLSGSWPLDVPTSPPLMKNDAGPLWLRSWLFRKNEKKAYDAAKDAAGRLADVVCALLPKGDNGNGNGGPESERRAA